MRHLKDTALLLCSAATLLVSGCGGGAASTTIAGTVTGLFPSATVVLQNNSADAISVGANGNFTFSGQAEAGTPYNVTVSTPPAGETCTVANGKGTVGQYSQDVNVSITCVVTNGAVIGSVSGLAAGKTVTLLNSFTAGAFSSGTETVAASANGSFVFKTLVTAGATYDVVVSVQPSGQTCAVTNGTGVIPASGGISPVLVACR